MLAKKLTVSVLLVLSIHADAYAEPATDAKQKTEIVQHYTSGNLEVTHDVGCVGFDDLSNEYTPADLYAATAKCFSSDKLEQASQLFALAGAYGAFDQQRVADASAHQAIQMLQMQLFQNEPVEKRKILGEHFIKAFSPDTPELAKSCDQIREIGAPNYFPRYMIQHGIKAFLEQQPNQGLVKDFNSADAWESALNSYLHCPSQE